jgi:hypothetical protein
MVFLETSTQHEEMKGSTTLSPGPSPALTPVSGWEYAYYSYESAHPHAVASIVRDATPDTFLHDASGNMTERHEGGHAWDQRSYPRSC